MGEPTDKVVAFASVATNIALSSRVTLAMIVAEKSKKFFDSDLKIWQLKMLFYLTTLSLLKFIAENISILLDDTLEKDQFMIIEEPNH